MTARMNHLSRSNDPEPRRVLIVDDEELSRIAIRKLLTRLFPSMNIVGEAANGKKALEDALSLQAEVVIMDIKLPVLNGLDAAAQIKQQSPRTKVVMLSAHDSFGFAQQALNSGMDGYLLKPVTEAEFEEVFLRALHGFETSVPIPSEKRGPYPLAAEEMFFRSLTHDTLGEMKATGAILAGLLENACPDPRSFEDYCSDFGAALRRILVKIGAQVCVLEVAEHFHNTHRNLKEFAPLRRLLLETLDKVAEGIAAQNQESPRTRILKILEGMPWSEVSLENVAAKLGMSPPYLSRVFKEHFGVKFVDHVTELKLQEAQNLLRSEPLTTEQVCRRLGWSDTAHFSRLFKEKTGQSPKAWLRTHS